MAWARGARDPATDTPEVLAAERGAAYLRYNGILSAYVPWLLRKVGRSGRLIEIGCGTGASTAAFAQACDRIVGYDIDPDAVEKARQRLAILGIDNAEVHAIGVPETAAIFEGGEPVDGIVFYATLDEMTAEARRALLSGAWAALRPGGFLLVGETRSALGRADGLGLTPDDFEAALGPSAGEMLVSTPDDPEIAGVFGARPELEATRTEGAGDAWARSFASPYLSLLFVKPDARGGGRPAKEEDGDAAPPDVEAFRAFARDPANFDVFAEMMDEALAPHVYLNWEHDAAYKRHFKRWQRAGFTVLPNHYYSPIPDLNRLTDEQLSARYPLHGVVLDESEHRAILGGLKAYQAETSTFRGRNTPTSDGRWYSGGAFGMLDAQVAYAMVRSQKPRRIIEIGTGFSTLAMAEACERNAAEGRPVEFTTIDPYPSFAVGLDPKGLTRNLTQPVESLPIETFDALEAGDILFIDSTHVIRPGGDVEYEYFHILPRLKPGVWVHVHDIFLPLSYPPEWARDRHIFWNEQQLLNAFLAYNHSFRAKLALAAACDRWIDAVKDAFPGTGDRPGPGSFWMQRVA